MQSSYLYQCVVCPSIYRTVHICIFLILSVDVYICLLNYLLICLFVGLYVCMYACMCVYMCLSLYACIYLSVSLIYYSCICLLHRIFVYVFVHIFIVYGSTNYPMSLCCIRHADIYLSLCRTAVCQCVLVSAISLSLFCILHVSVVLCMHLLISLQYSCLHQQSPCLCAVLCMCFLACPRYRYLSACISLYHLPLTPCCFVLVAAHLSAIHPSVSVYGYQLPLC